MQTKHFSSTLIVEPCQLCCCFHYPFVSGRTSSQLILVLPWSHVLLSSDGYLVIRLPLCCRNELSLFLNVSSILPDLGDPKFSGSILLIKSCGLLWTVCSNYDCLESRPSVVHFESNISISQFCIAIGDCCQESTSFCSASFSSTQWILWPDVSFRGQAKRCEDFQVFINWNVTVRELQSCLGHDAMRVPLCRSVPG